MQVTIRADGDRLRVRLVADSAAGAEALQHGAARQQLEAGTHAATRATLEILHHNTGQEPSGGDQLAGRQQEREAHDRRDRAGRHDARAQTEPSTRDDTPRRRSRGLDRRA